MIGALDAAAARHGIALDNTVRGRIGQWMVLLARHNLRANLIGPLDAHRFADELVVDSLHALPFVPKGARIVDIGSGAGLPGTPIALARRDVHMTWVEPRSKRALFLGTASRELGIGGTVVEGRVEALDPDARFDVAVSRAVFAPGEWLAVAAGLLLPGGTALAWCNGAPDDARAELDVPAELTPAGEATYTLADGRPRCVLAFRRGDRGASEEPGSNSAGRVRLWHVGPIQTERAFPFRSMWRRVMCVRLGPFRKGPIESAPALWI